MKKISIEQENSEYLRSLTACSAEVMENVMLNMPSSINLLKVQINELEKQVDKLEARIEKLEKRKCE